MKGIHDLSLWRSRLAEAMETDPQGSTVEDLEQGLVSGRYIALEIDGSACAVLEMTDDHRGRRLHIAALAGRFMKRWLDTLERTVLRIAREQGAERITLGGRLGWQKQLKHYGFRTESVVLSRSIKP